MPFQLASLSEVIPSFLIARPLSRAFASNFSTSTFTSRIIASPISPRRTTPVRRLSSSSPTKMGDTTKFCIALCQMPVSADKSRNLSVAAQFLRNACGVGASLAVLPECFNCPYDTKCFPEYAESLPEVGVRDAHTSESVRSLQESARETGMIIVGGSVPELGSDGKIYNTSITVAADGTVLAKHRKMHLFDIDVPGGIKFRESDALSAGNAVTTFHAPSLNCTIGIGICYDLRFPELAMLQARFKAAQLLIYPGAFNMTTGPAHWELLLRARALDNQLYVAACSPARDVSGKGYTAWGHSTIVDPWGTVIASTDETPDILCAYIELGKVPEIRNAIPISKQRREDVYHLTAMTPTASAKDTEKASQLEKQEA